jgi:hypothetical protein
VILATNPFISKVGMSHRRLEEELPEVSGCGGDSTRNMTFYDIFVYDDVKFVTK